MKQACLFCSGGRISQMDCTFFLALSSAALLGVGRRGCFSSLLFTDVTFTVGFCPSGCFRRCSSFVYLLSNFRALENFTSLPVFLQLKILSLKVGLIFRCIQNFMEENIVEIFHFHFLGVVRSWKEQQGVVHFRQPFQKILKVVLQGLHIARLIAHFFQESELIGGE